MSARFLRALVFFHTRLHDLIQAKANDKGKSYHCENSGNVSSPKHNYSFKLERYLIYKTRIRHKLSPQKLSPSQTRLSLNLSSLSKCKNKYATIAAAPVAKMLKIVRKRVNISLACSFIKASITQSKGGKVNANDTHAPLAHT